MSVYGVYTSYLYICIYIYRQIHMYMHARTHTYIHIYIYIRIYRYRCAHKNTHIYTLHYITLHCITLHYITLHYITLRCVTIHYITLHYITLHYITLHYIPYIHTYYSTTCVNVSNQHICIRVYGCCGLYIYIHIVMCTLQFSFNPFASRECIEAKSPVGRDLPGVHLTGCGQYVPSCSLTKALGPQTFYLGSYYRTFVTDVNMHG